MKFETSKLIEKELKNYRQKNIKISDKRYTLHVVPELCDEDLNVFEGFLFVEADNKSEVSYLKTRYRPPVSGYAPRIGIILYDGHLLLKDYRKNKHIIKTLKKINKTFLNKLKKALSEPSDENLSKLFDRSDVIEEFYILYKKARDYLLKNIKGIPEEEKREEFVDNFMMQMLTLWYLQERGFFNNDKNYFITKFKESKQKKLSGEFKNNYYGFLTYLFEKLGDNLDRQYYNKDKIVGKVVVIGPAVFLNGEHSKAISIPDKCFYKEGMTDILINTPPKRVSQEVPLLNLFESRDWTEGNIDEFVLGAIYEKLITYMERKKLGAYYTPEEITSYICKNTIEPYLVDKVNERFKRNFETIDQIIESNDKDILFYLFEQLKEIKILDPAVGSAHFLESAINVLVSIYEKIKEKAIELGIKKGLEIIATDEKGEIETKNLLEISDDKFKLLIKFFIILSKNIYGVDIKPSALKIAKARLFLTLAKHFKVGKEKDNFIRFPNVHFNLRDGNSLIGYVDIERQKPKGQLQLDLFVNEEQAEYIVEKIKVVSELKPHLEKTANALEISGNVVNEVKDLNRILLKKQISWYDFEKVLRTKEKLIRILIASLNSQYAEPLNKLLGLITDLFNHKLDEKFAEEHNIKLEDLKKIKTFHWIFEFPEVFLDRGGFDVVVGNPPYVRQEGINHIVEGIDYKEILSRIYEPFDNTFDFSMFFILRSIWFSKDKGYHSFIITNKWLRAKYGKKIRRFLKENLTIKKVIDFNGIRVFVGATVDTLVYVIQKKKPERDNLIFYNHPLSWDSIEQGGYKVKQASLSDDIWNFVDERTEEIKKWIEKVGKPLKGLDVKIYRGITTGFNEAFVIDNETRKRLIEEDPKSAELIKPLLRGRDIGRYYVEWDNIYLLYIPWHFPLHSNKITGASKKAEEKFKKQYPAVYNHLHKFKDELMNRNKEETGIRYEWYALQRFASDYYHKFEKPKIVFARIIKEPKFFYDLSRFYIEATGYILTSTITLPLKYLLLLLNCYAIYNIFYKFYSGGGVDGEIKINKLQLLPIYISHNFEPYIILSDYLLSLYSTNNIQKHGMTVFDYIADSLVYEVYFKEKFAEDGIYPEPKEYLLEAVSKHLKPINYDRWAELYWKKQLEGNLKPEEEKELEDLENENLKTIIEVAESIKSDREIVELIEKIKSHEWVRVVEGNPKIDREVEW